MKIKIYVKISFSIQTLAVTFLEIFETQQINYLEYPFIIFIFNFESPILYILDNNCSLTNPINTYHKYASKFWWRFNNGYVIITLITSKRLCPLHLVSKMDPTQFEEFYQHILSMVGYHEISRHSIQCADDMDERDVLFNNVETNFKNNYNIQSINLNSSNKNHLQTSIYNNWWLLLRILLKKININYVWNSNGDDTYLYLMQKIIN